jgi:hypothetical protein
MVKPEQAADRVAAPERTTITFQRGLNEIIAVADTGHSCQTRGRRQKSAAAVEQKGAVAAP